MKYFRNTELANIYNVSEKSVRNWVQAAKEGKLALQLYDHNGKDYVANTPANSLYVKQLVEKGKKYKNSRSVKVISPSSEFYKTYTDKQIFDIISSLTIHHEIPLQYSYLEGGATYWDTYANRLYSDKAPNILTNTIGLLDANLANLDQLLTSTKQINVIDLGPGNGLPVKKLLAHLLEAGRLKRYIAIDISQEMLDITEKHIKEWFGDKVTFEGHIRDFSTERFDDLFAEDYAGDDEDIPINLVLLLSATICNFRSPDHALRIIHDCLGLDDLFVYTTKLDTPNSRRYFDLGIETAPRPLDFLFKVVIDKLNLDPSLYEVEQYFDEQAQARFVKLRPKLDIMIEFKLSKGIRRVCLQKNVPVLLWRFWHHEALDVINQFDRNDFDLMHATKTQDKEYLLLVSKIKNE